ncbi:unnamed protein product [Plutella xylostella]|uniref:(diamondback moth) hypothetical protein n=1 Tax=Plutella xylostella TaxID=51655 RepID=A0A8S4GC19_PLUXY|nr:unnamed protein product [Plutella xylostella]
MTGDKRRSLKNPTSADDETREIDGRTRSESGDADSVYHVRGALTDQRWREQRSAEKQTPFLFCSQQVEAKENSGKIQQTSLEGGAKCTRHKF